MIYLIGWALVELFFMWSSHRKHFDAIIREGKRRAEARNMDAK